MIGETGDDEWGDGTKQIFASFFCFRLFWCRTFGILRRLNRYLREFAMYMKLSMYAAFYLSVHLSSTNTTTDKRCITNRFGNDVLR